MAQVRQDMGRRSMNPTASSDRFWDLVTPDAELSVIGEGFIFTEGPIWHPDDHHLLFSDMPGDVRRRWDSDGIREVMRPANKCNGMTYDADLNLLVCEHVTSSVVREYPDGRRVALATHFEGSQLNSPNDVCVRSDGSIYFSDPWYGRMPVFGLERERPLGWQGVFRLPAEGGEPQLLVGRDEFDQPNGVCFSPDESLFYVNDTSRGVIRVYRVLDDGSIADGRQLVEGLSSDDVGGAPDGMKCDAIGNIWVTGPGGVHVFDPTGRPLGFIPVDEVVGNLHWGGPDWHTLFLACSTTLRSMPTLVGPRPEPFMRI
jgi:gluconolactonase